MQSKRKARAHGEDLDVESTLSRNARRITGQEPQGQGRKVVNAPYADAAGFKVYEEAPGGRKDMRGQRKYGK